MSIEFVVTSAKDAYVDLLVRADSLDAQIAQLTKEREAVQKQIDEASAGLDELYAVTKIDLGKDAVRSKTTSPFPLNLPRLETKEAQLELSKGTPEDTAVSKT